MGRLSTIFSTFAPAAAVAAMVLSAPVARADEFVDKANGLIGKIPDARRSDLVMLPVIGKMDAEPDAFVGTDDASVFDSTSGSWPGFLEWANKPAQRAVIEALAKVTTDNAYQTRMVFALPYGVESVSPELVMNGMYVELGDPPTLASAKFMYLEKMDDVCDLVMVEANRLVGEGKPADALKVLTNGLYFMRQLADRPSAHEKGFGMHGMSVMLEMMRDVAYRDSRLSAPKLTPDQLKDAVKAITEKDLLSIDRIGFANYDRIAADQVASRVFLASGKPNPATFSATMSRIASGDRPLRLFSEAGQWDREVNRHKDAANTKKMITNIADDLSKRWSLDAFDPYMSRTEDLDKASKTRYAVVHPLFRTTDELLDERQKLRAEAAGTRMALGVQAFVLKNKGLPPDFSAIRPAFVAEIDTDPYRAGKKRLSFFVPIRDTSGPRGDSGPHEMRVFQVPAYPNFSVKLGQDQFVIYAAGPDESADGAKDATQADPQYKTGDLVLWPPRFALVRQYLTEQGRLK